jgi:hypothetical protein
MDSLLEFNDLMGRPISVNARHVSAIKPGEGFDGSCIHLAGVEQPLVSGEPASLMISKWCRCLSLMGAA